MCSSIETGKQFPRLPCTKFTKLGWPEWGRPLAFCFAARLLGGSDAINFSSLFQGSGHDLRHERAGNQRPTANRFGHNPGRVRSPKLCLPRPVHSVLGNPIDTIRPQAREYRRSCKASPHARARRAMPRLARGLDHHHVFLC